MGWSNSCWYGNCPKISNTLFHTSLAQILLFMQLFLKLLLAFSYLLAEKISCSAEISMNKSFITSRPDCADARADHSLCWTDMQSHRKCCGPFHFQLTLKTPRKPASENVVCLCRLLNILANISNLFLHTGKQCGHRSDCS